MTSVLLFHHRYIQRKEPLCWRGSGMALSCYPRSSLPFQDHSMGSLVTALRTMLIMVRIAAVCSAVSGAPNCAPKNRLTAAMTLAHIVLDFQTCTIQITFFCKNCIQPRFCQLSICVSENSQALYQGPFSTVPSRILRRPSTLIPPTLEQ